MNLLWSIIFCAIFGIIKTEDSLGIPKDFTVGDDVLTNRSRALGNEYADAYSEYMRSGVESPRLQYLTKQFLAERTDIDWLKHLHKAQMSEKFVACSVCRAAMSTMLNIINNPDPEAKEKEQKAKEVLLDYCNRFNITTLEVCAGYFNVLWPAMYIIVQNPNIDQDILCNVLRVPGCAFIPPNYNWTLEINNNGANTTTIDKPKSKKPTVGDNALKILHITDIHYDPEYQPGTVANCNEPLCCQGMSTESVSPKELAGYWSDYNVCDAPMHLIENALDHMRKTHTKIDFIYHTGDIVPHTGWKTTRDGNKNMLTEIDNIISQKFPGIPVYTCLGNHDSHPSDLFSPEDVPEEVNTKWLYEHVYELWSKWLSTDTKETILKGGYYTVSPRHGFRIISLNNLDCYINNWWLYYNGTYATEQLEWLHDTLLAAENAGEFVHILTHVPTGGTDCWTVWSREFNRLVQRFHLTISGIFNGHTHLDEINVFYTSKGHAINVAWNAGSITTFTEKNPNYRIYDVEPHTMEVADFENWSFNLTAANLHGANRTPEWYKLCHFSKDFTDDLSPAGLDNLLEKMVAQPDLLRKYWVCKITNADPYINDGCNKECLKGHICELVTTSFNQQQRCHELQAKLEQNMKSNSRNEASPTKNEDNPE